MDAAKDISCDLMIIGTGMAGMAAALFAAHHRIDARQVGMTSEIGFASGLLDLLGVHPIPEGKVLVNPWQGIEQLRRDDPGHPYSRTVLPDIRRAMDLFTDFLGTHGYPYVTEPERNLMIPTPVGTLKPTYAVPHTMAGGPRILMGRVPCLVVDFKGLRGFSARQIVHTLAARRPGLRPLSIAFPGMSQGELYTEHMARLLDTADHRKALIAAIRPHLGDAGGVALPAVLGIYRTREAMADLRDGLGVPVFEIPTLLPAITGLRLQEIFEQQLPAMGITAYRQQRVLHAQRQSDGRWTLHIGRDRADQRVVARSVLLCSGRFFGKGLHAERCGIRETIFDLPVSQPPHRAIWHDKDLLHRAGHPINRAGVAIDDHFRPVDAEGGVLYPNLFAAGSILAGQDWIRQKCGSGLAIATAFGAVAACRNYL